MMKPVVLLVLPTLCLVSFRESQRLFKAVRDSVLPQILNPQGIEDSRRDISIFFHTFSQVNNTALAHDIVTSQLQSINSQPLLDASTVYYTRFGHLESDWPLPECQKTDRNCIELLAKPEGNEIETLQLLFEHCTKHENDRVIYIHSKGAFHPSESNDQLRALDMQAVTSKDCLQYDSTTANDNANANGTTTCNTCSAQFFDHPTHFTGNMWVADCDYVAKLIPPVEFLAAKERVISNMINATKPTVGNPKMCETRFPDGTSYQIACWRDWQVKAEEYWTYLGLGRWSGEHWIGSHPDLKPCDVFSQADGNPALTYDLSSTVSNYTLLQQMSPRLRKAPSGIFSDIPLNKRFHPWFQRDGRLQQYKALYSKIPGNESWFHSYWKGWPDWTPRNKEDNEVKAS